MDIPSLEGIWHVTTPWLQEASSGILLPRGRTWDGGRLRCCGSSSVDAPSEAHVAEQGLTQPIQQLEGSGTAGVTSFQREITKH